MGRLNQIQVGLKNLIGELIYDIAALSFRGIQTDRLDTVEPSTTSIVSLLQPRDIPTLPIPRSEEREAGARDLHLPAELSPLEPETVPTDEAPLTKVSNEATTGTAVHGRRMTFGSNLATSSHRRRAMANTNALTKYEADLTDQDRAKQKEAVRRYLAERVKSDWEWEWPRPEELVSLPPESPLATPTDLARSVSATTKEQWKERDEWLSNVSEGEDLALSTVESGAKRISQAARDDFHLGSPEEVGSAIRKYENERKRRHKKRLAEEMVWNDGVRCFVQRRDAWTGARLVTVPLDARLTPVRTNRSSTYVPAPSGQSSSADVEQETDSEWEWATEIPIAAPILPPENAMRASITPAAYNTIYDKVILQQLTPSCPMNLKDVTRSCVQGWKRDGEWPPKATEVPKKKGRRLSLVSLFSFDKTDADKEKDKEKEKGKEKREADERVHAGEKVSRGPGATIGKGIRKIMFWKDKDHAHANAAEFNGKGEGKRGSSPAP